MSFWISESFQLHVSFSTGLSHIPFGKLSCPFCQFIPGNFYIIQILWILELISLFIIGFPIIWISEAIFGIMLPFDCIGLAFLEVCFHILISTDLHMLCTSQSRYFLCPPISKDHFIAPNFHSITFLYPNFIENSRIITFAYFGSHFPNLWQAFEFYRFNWHLTQIHL
jgi:hypothetical protein